MDDTSGVVLNPNFETYKLPGIADVPEIDVVLINMPERGVIGVGEPCHIPTAAAIANAVANALGVRVPSLHHSRARARGAGQSQTRRHMKAFQYASARSVASAQQLAADNGRFLGGGVDLLGEIKDYIAEPRVVVNVKTISGLDRIERGADKWTLGANVTVAQIESDAKLAKVFPGLQQAAAGGGSQQ